MRIMQQQIGTREPSQHLLEDKGKPRKCVERPSTDLANSSRYTPCRQLTHGHLQRMVRATTARWYHEQLCDGTVASRNTRFHRQIASQYAVEEIHVVKRVFKNVQKASACRLKECGMLRCVDWQVVTASEGSQCLRLHSQAVQDEVGNFFNPVDTASVPADLNLLQQHHCRDVEYVNDFSSVF